MLGFLSAPALSSLAGPLPADHQREYVASGYAGTAATIERMRQMVALHKRDFRVRTLAGQIVQSCGSKDYYCYAKKLFTYCRDQIRYAFDPARVELVESPVHVLKSRVADCDSITVTLAALAESLGLHTRYVTVKANPNSPSEFSHVYLRIFVPPSRFSTKNTAGWIGADATMPDKDFGWEPPLQVVKDGKLFKIERKEWPGSSDETLAEQDEELTPSSRSQPAVSRSPSSPQPLRIPGRQHRPNSEGVSSLDWMSFDTLLPGQRDVSLTRLGLRGIEHLSLGTTRSETDAVYNDAALLLNKVRTVAPPASMSAEYADKVENWQNAFGQADTLIMAESYDTAEYILNALKEDMTQWLARVERAVAPEQRQRTIDIIQSLPGISPTPPSVDAPSYTGTTRTTDWGTLLLLAAAGAAVVLLAQKSKEGA